LFFGENNNMMTKWRKM